MNPNTRQFNATFSTSSRTMSIATAMVIAAGLGFAALSMTSIATAQEIPRETAREQANNSNASQFPTEQSMEEGLKFAVAGGQLSEQQASSLMRVYKRLAMGIENEKLSVNEALAILEERAIDISEGDQDAARRDYADAQASMQKMVDAGKITEEQMQQRLDRMKVAITAQSEPSITRADYAKAQADMQKMVDAGEITKDQMNARLGEMRRMIGASGEAQRAFRKEYEAAAAKMAEMVKAGEITREQMQQRLDRMKAKMAAEAQPSVTRADYAKAQADMQKMVDAGEITEADMKGRLNRMRKMMGPARDAQNQITRADYAKAQADMQKMVDAGELTEADMKGRLNRMRKMIGRGNGDRNAEGREREAVSDDCMDLRRRLGEAVRGGTMTREEAGELWKSEGC
jgi:hypothetical protein